MDLEMSSPRPAPLRRFVRALYAGIDAARRFVVNLVFLSLLALVLLVWLAGGGRTRLQDDTALVVDIRGDLVEEYSGSAREVEVAEALGAQERETQLRDLLAAIDAAAEDSRIPRIVLLLDDLGSAGMAKLHEVAAAIDRFRAKGKQVIAWGSALDQHRYYLAAHADEVYLHPQGAVLLTGFGGYRNYYHDALERLGISVNVFRAGKFKSFVEPFTSNGPSKEAMEQDALWLNDAWATYSQDIEAARHLPAGALARLIDTAPQRLAATDGDMARLALEAKLVDALKTRDQLRSALVQRGKPDKEHKTFRQVSLDEYRSLVPDRGSHERQVGILVAAGTIKDGDEPQGAIGGRSTAELIRRAREDDTIKALVVRVDSPGGSAFGSELVRRELELTRQAGKPVVISMSDVAASGGYWISTSADRIIADASTITGSIGVFGILPTAERGLDKLGIHTAGVTTAWLAGAADLRRPLDPRLGAIIQSQVSHTYREFLARVAQGRKIDVEQVNEIAQGRVWTGRQALERGLVDELGGVKAAVRAASGLAKLADGYHVVWVENEPKVWYRLLASLPGASLRSALVDALGLAPAGAAALATQRAPEARLIPAAIAADLRWLSAAKASAGAWPLGYAYCLCGAP